MFSESNFVVNGDIKKVLQYFFLAYLISWLIWLPLVLQHAGIHVLPVLPGYHHYLGSFGPMIAAMIITYRYEGRKGLRVMLHRMTSWRVRGVWYILVVVIPVLLVIAAGYADQLLNGRAFSMKGFSVNQEFPRFGVISYFLFNFFTFGIGEETGWRGFALPGLQKKYTALAASLMLAVGWACWHIPAFLYRPLYSQMDAAGITGFFLSMVMGSVIMTWLYNSTRGSILIVALFHTMIELMFMSDNITGSMSSWLGAAIMIVALLIILITKPANLSFEVKQT